MNFAFNEWLKRGSFQIITALVVTILLVGCTQGDEVNITLADEIISPNTISDVKNILISMSLIEIPPNPNYPNENLHFEGMGLNVFIPPQHKRPWKLDVLVVGESSFSDRHKQIYRKLVENLQKKFGMQSVIADSQSSSGEKMLLVSP
jgi:hypothetical protein